MDAPAQIRNLRSRLLRMQEEVGTGVDNQNYWNGLISDVRDGLRLAMAAFHEGDHAEINRIHTILLRADPKPRPVFRSCRRFGGLFR